MDKRPPTVKDIAEAAGVSIATVSRVLNRKGRYSEATKERVLQVVDELGYVVNIAAQQLKTQRTNYVGILVPDITNEFFAKVVQTIQQHLMQKDYTTLICNTNEDPYLEAMHFEMLREQNIAGLISVSGSRPLDGKLTNIPLVFVDRRPLNEDDTIHGVSIVESDHRQGARLAVSALHAKGSRRIACLSPELPASSHEFRVEAFKESLKAFELPFEERWELKVDGVDYLSAREEVRAALDRGDLDVDAIFCTSDWLAIGAVDSLQDAGLKIPDEISIVGFDDISVAEFRDLPLTTIRQDVATIGQEAVRLLTEQLKNPDQVGEHKIVPVQLIERATTK